VLTCRHASRLISDALDRPLSWLERLRLRFHLLGCGPCRRFRRATGWLHEILAAASPQTPLPDDARDRIGRALARAGGDTAGG
jgi:hypothetical protein